MLRFTISYQLFINLYFDGFRKNFHAIDRMNKVKYVINSLNAGQNQFKCPHVLFE